MKAILTILFLRSISLACGMLLCAFSLCFAQQLTWKEFGKLRNARHYFGGLVFTPQQVLVMGGYINSNGVLTGEITTSCEFINVVQRTITDAAPMNVARAESVFLLTPDSNIVTISGLSKNNQTTPTCELYSRVTKNWTILGSLNVGRRQHIACFINRDEILVVGGRNNTVGTVASTEIFNIRTGRSRSVQNFPYPINLGVAGISSRNKPFFFGGRSGGANSFRTLDVHEYDATNNRWLIATRIREGVHGPNLLKLWDGRLFLSGGAKQEEPVVFSANAVVEGYPEFTQVSPIQARHWHTMAQWNADSIAVIGGFDENLNNMRSVEWIDLKRQQRFTAPPLLEPHGRFISVSVPEFDANGKQTKAVLLAISGLLNDNSTNTPTVEILEETFRQAPPFPTIASMFTETDDCSTFRLTLRATTGTIQNLELGTSANVSLQALTPLPGTTIDLLVRVVNPAVPPVLVSLRITDSTGRTQLVALTSAFPQRFTTALRLVSQPERLFGDSTVALTCATLRIRNDARTEAVFSVAYFSKNREFSAPPSQFPLRIPASSEAALRVCYAPSALGLQRDTITFTEGCSVLQIPLVARGAAPIFEGVTRCAAPARLRGTLPLSSEQTVIVADIPFPQPASDVVVLSFQAVSISGITDKPRITLYNNLGIQQGIFTADEWVEARREDETYRYTGRVSLRVGTLPMGLYRAHLTTTNGAFTSAAIFVVR